MQYPAQALLVETFPAYVRLGSSGLRWIWCGRRDLNPQAFRRQLLRLVCLPFHHFRAVSRAVQGLWIFASLLRQIKSSMGPAMHPPRIRAYCRADGSQPFLCDIFIYVRWLFFYAAHLTPRHGRVAQLAEHSALNRQVEGSIPSASTILPDIFLCVLEGRLAASTESSSRTRSRPVPPLDPPYGCARRSPDSPPRSQSSSSARGRR